MIGNIVKKSLSGQTKTVNASPTTTQIVTPDVGKELTQVTVNKLTASAALGNAKVSEVAEGKTFSSSNGILLTGTAPIIPTAHIYGVEWAGNSSPSMTRTDEAANFSNPNPYYAGMSTTPSSPFDSLYPLAGMNKSTISKAGVVVSIPKYYYKLTKTGAKIKLQIADQYVPGFSVSPAHADRGNGLGELDVVYIGRYSCAGNYKSQSGVAPAVSKTRASFRTGISQLGNLVLQLDLAMYLTIAMLYLVEYANLNSQSMIGAGASVSYAVINTGSTDSMPYHTGTMKSSKDTYGGGIQYRYIEDLLANVMNFVDGINIINTNDIYCILEPTSFADNTTTNATKVGTRTFTSNYIKNFNIPNISGFEYALLPNESASSGTQYICDYMLDGMTGSTGVVLVGGCAEAKTDYGLFHIETYASTKATTAIGSRLMVL